MKQELYDYDIYPKVIRAGTKSKISVRPLGIHSCFPAEGVLVRVLALDNGPWQQPAEYSVAPGGDGVISILHTFPDEQMYFLKISAGDRQICTLSVYAVDSDLCGLYPYMGDLHMHSCRSDGREDPCIVAANYRQYGYDFTVISDHRRYYPSLEAKNAYADVPINLNIVPGEEIHLPDNDVHIVNFGGEYGINGLFSGSAQYRETNGDKAKNSLVTCPDAIDDDEYRRQVRKIAGRITDFPAEISEYLFTYASCVWICDRIREAGGLAIFCHPYWINYVYQLPRRLTEYILEKKPFDAFEVLGGENYYEHNGQQTHEYYTQRMRYGDFPVVGSTDSHGSTEHNRNRAICETIVFADKNERAALISAVKSGKSVAVDTISREFRLVGNYRLVRYAMFLMQDYFPLHDLLCFEEGRLMREYYTEKTKQSCEALWLFSGRGQRLLEKYFAF